MEELPGSASSEDTLSPRANFQPLLTGHLPLEIWQMHYRECTAPRGVCLKETNRNFKEWLPQSQGCQVQSAGWAAAGDREELMLHPESDGHLEEESPPTLGGPQAFFS